ncbi:MAG: helix-turn-helix domain-containing protein [Pseudomonadota bacterium]
MKKENETATSNDGHTQNCKNIVTKAPTTLKPSQAKVASILYQFMGEYIHTFKFRELGIANPAQRVSELKMAGAVIDTVYKPAIDSAGEAHPKVAYYRFFYWENNSDE